MYRPKTLASENWKCTAPISLHPTLENVQPQNLLQQKREHVPPQHPLQQKLMKMHRPKNPSSENLKMSVPTPSLAKTWKCTDPRPFLLKMYRLNSLNLFSLERLLWLYMFWCCDTLWFLFQIIRKVSKHASVFQSVKRHWSCWNENKSKTTVSHNHLQNGNWFVCWQFRRSWSSCDWDSEDFGQPLQTRDKAEAISG